jgi:hypothetical protein
MVMTLDENYSRQVARWYESGNGWPDVTSIFYFNA